MSTVPIQLIGEALFQDDTKLNIKRLTRSKCLFVNNETVNILDHVTQIHNEIIRSFNA